jgi:inner membrane protein
VDTITHALSGALIARATARNRPDALPLRTRMLAGTAAAAFPDADIVVRAFDALTYLTTHRGVTHSLVLLPLWSIALALLFSTFARSRFRWRQFVGVAALGLAIHIAGDVITSWGTMILAPLSDRRFAFATTFIIDPIFTAIILAGLVAAWAVPKRAWIASGALVLLVGYVGVQAWLRSEAVEIGERYRAAAGLHAVAVEALPQALSPWRWKILVETGDAYHEASVDLRRREPAPPAPENAGLIARLAAAYQPRDRLAWRRRPKFGDGDARIVALEAWNDPALRPYRRFARFAVLDHLSDDPTGRTCVFFQDLRFTLAGRPPVFRYGACRPRAGIAWELVS